MLLLQLFNMKKLFISLAIGFAAIAAQAQTVTIRVIANDGSLQTTNTISMTSSNALSTTLAGVIAAWGKDSASKSNAGNAALNLSTFVVQEVTDKSSEWFKAGIESLRPVVIAQMKTIGLTNNVTPSDDLVVRWNGFTAAKQTNIVNTFNLFVQ